MKLIDRIKKRYGYLKKLSKEKGKLEWNDFNRKEKTLFVSVLAAEIGMIIFMGIILIFVLVLLLLTFVLKVLT